MPRKQQNMPGKQQNMPGKQENIPHYSVFKLAALKQMTCGFRLKFWASDFGFENY